MGLTLNISYRILFVPNNNCLGILGQSWVKKIVICYNFWLNNFKSYLKYFSTILSTAIKKDEPENKRALEIKKALEMKRELEMNREPIPGTTAYTPPESSSKEITRIYSNPCSSGKVIECLFIIT